MVASRSEPDPRLQNTILSRAALADALTAAYTKNIPRIGRPPALYL